jgi:BASS family bile acid:Na+ symporter
MTLIQAGGLFTFLWLAMLMVQMGLTVTLREITGSVRDTVHLLKGIAGNFILVPMGVAGFLWVLKADPMVSAGVITLVVFAGAPLGPQFSEIARADIPFSIGLMVILTFLSVVISPALLSVLLPFLSGTDKITIHYGLILKTLLLLQIIPLGAGLAIRRFFPGFSRMALKPVRIITILFMLVACVLIAVAEYGTFTEFGGWAWAGCAAIFLYTLWIGRLMGGREQGRRKTMTLTTGVRNAAAAMVIGISNFGGSVALTAILVYAAFSTFGALAVAFLMRVVRVAGPSGQGITQDGSDH